MGPLQARHDYQPFGVEMFPTNGLAHDGFGGKELDTETGANSSGWLALNYFGARHLHAASGRFTVVDPIVVLDSLWDPQIWGRYSYARNNPLKFVDPDGRKLVFASKELEDF